MNLSHFRLVIITFLSLFILFSCSKSNEAIINEEVEKTKVRLPAEINQHTTWIDIKAGQNEIVFIYEIKGVDQSVIDDKIIAESKEKTISGLRTQKNVEKFFKRNINFTFIYLDEEKNELMNITITRNDLGY